METKEILQKYSRKLEKEIKTETFSGDYSREYQQFKSDMLPQITRYEKICNAFGSLISIKLSKKDEEKLRKQLNTAHIDITPEKAMSLAVISLLGVFFTGILLSGLFFFINGVFPFLLFFISLGIALFLFYYTYTYPARLANSWRLKASSQIVPAILYIVAYMKHTSNLERAVRFASTHLQPPLSLDFKKIFWDIETGKYSTIKESLDNYLDTWREHNIEFIESFHLIESSLYEPTESRRIEILEKSLQVVLDGVYEKMLKYSRDIRGPLTTVYMLGIVLPTLALALLPMASTLLQGAIQWHHVFLIFNLIVPFFVFYLTSEILLKRPGGYGESELLEKNPLYWKFTDTSVYTKALLIALPFFILGLLPLIFQYTSFPELLGLEKDFTLNKFGLNEKLFDFKTVGGQVSGPFGAGALLLSLLVPFSIAIFFSLAFNWRSRELIKARDESKQLENEFASSLFQLGNRLADGVPAEIVFSRVAESSKGLITENFFRTINQNIQQLGMSLEDAIFHPRRGAIIYYPSALIATSMKILVESVKKGLQIAASSLMSISQYIKNIQKIQERLRDLLAEVVSDMRSNMTFLAPLLAGIVVGLSGMITLILSRLQILQSIAGEELGFAGNIQNFMKLFNVTTMIPPYYIQIAIGIYIVQIIFILTSALVTIDSGEDKLKTVYEIAVNLRRGIILYVFAAFFSIVALSVLAMIALAGIA